MHNSNVPTCRKTSSLVNIPTNESMNYANIINGQLTTEGTLNVHKSVNII